MSETFSASGARTTSTLNATTGTASAVTGAGTSFGGAVSLAYDAATGGYTVTDATGAAVTFLPANKSPSSNATRSIYSQGPGNQTDQLVLFNPGAANPTMALTYVSYGAWQRVTNNPTTVDVAQQYFLFGIRQAANAPSTGGGTYTTIVDGFWTNPAGIYALGGTSSFTADFSAMTVATSLDLVGTRNGSAPKSFGLFSGTGTIEALGGGFSGTFAHQGTDGDGNVYSGGFNGAFFGPQGQEVGYTFSLTGPGGAAAGAVVGKKN